MSEPRNFTSIAFTDTVKAIQQRQGSRESYDRMAAAGDRFELGDPERRFIHDRDTMYMATVGSNGWPYVQHRGGPRGFLRVLDASTIAFADFRGNRQYVSTGNVADTKRVALILVDYPHQAHRPFVPGHLRARRNTQGTSTTSSRSTRSTALKIARRDCSTDRSGARVAVMAGISMSAASSRWVAS